MTARQLFEYTLIEMNKVQAPSLLLEDYNYFINKAVYNYINLRYNVYDVNQQTTDDLRVLKGTVAISNIVAVTGNKLQGATYTADLPADYFHMLNCIVEYTATKVFKCYTPSEPVYFGAKRLTSDMYSQIINNYYLRPSYKLPYYYIHNTVDTPPPANPTSPNVPEIQEGVRYSGGAPVKVEIRYGKDNSLFTLTRIHIDYLKAPRRIVLTQAEVDLTDDTSQVLEFPDYVCQEIIKELTKLLLENASDPRLQTNIPVNQTIANPAQEQQQQGKR